jgi:uncharacterized protein
MLRPLAAVLLAGAVSPMAQAQVSITALGVPVTENFDSLVNTGTSSALPPGWAFSEIGGDATYGASDGASNTGNVYSYGTNATTERAFGSLLSGTRVHTIGAQFQNNTGGTIQTLAIAFTGEQWRVGVATASAREDQLDFQYSLDATSLTTGTWIDADPLDFNNPINSAVAAGALNGNLAANRTAISHTLTGLTIPASSNFWIRWNDLNAASSDDGLAIDDFSLTAPLPTPSLSVSDATVTEGNSGDTPLATFTVTLTNAASDDFTVDFATSDNASALAGTDYTTSAGTLNFDAFANGTTRTFTVPMIGDDTPEPDETFTVTLSNVQGNAAVVIGDATGTGTIEDDEPRLSVADASIVEGDSGTSTLQFTVSLDAPAGASGVTFDYATADGTATVADSDYDSKSGTDGVIAAGQSTTTVDVTIRGDTTQEVSETFTLAITNVVGAVVVDGTTTGTIQDNDAPVQAIHDIQGAGSASPLAVGTDVKIVGAVVTAVTAMPPAAANGFFIQTADAAADANPLTSQGIFVFTSGAPTVAVGNEVTVVGKVAEFFGQTQIDNVVSVTVTNPAVPLPTAITFSTASGLPSRDPAALSCPGTGPGGANNVDTNFECFEGMRITIPDGLVARSNQRRATDLFAEVFVTTHGERSRREQGVNYPTATTAGNAAAGQFDSNPELFEMDADEAGLFVFELTAGTTFSATGVMGYSFGDYEFYPTQLTINSAAPVPQGVMTAVGGNELTVASFNTKHLCDDLDDDGDANDNDGDSDCARDSLYQGAPVSYAQKLAMVSAYVRTVLGTPDVVGFQEVDSLSTLQALAAQINADTAGVVTYSAYLTDGNDPGGINVGYLTRNGRIANVVTEQFYLTTTWPDPNGLDTLHDRPPLLLTADFMGPGGPYPFAVMNNHTKARSLVDNTGAAAERDRAKRFWQARDIANLVQQFQTATGPFAGEGTDDVPLILVGDYNAFEYTDGYVDVVGLIAGTYNDAANECNAVLSGGAGTETCNLGVPNIVSPALYNTGFAVGTNERISYLFTQNFGNVQGGATRDVPAVQVIDHILLSRSAQGFFAATDYGIANNAASDETARNSTGAINSSDHDGLVTYLNFDCLNDPVLNPDGDQVCGMLDNCPNVANDDQADGDNDGIGNACDVNNAPTISDTVDQSTAEDVAEVVNFTIGDAETAVTCSATHLSAASTNLALVPVANIVFSGTAPNCVATITPVLDQSGTSTITLTVSDGVATASDDFVQTVTSVNDAPTISDTGDQTTAEEVAEVVNFTIGDVDSTLTCSATHLSAASSNLALVPVANVAFSGTAPNCVATITPALNQTGTSTITLTVSDGTATANDAFVQTVTDINDAPTISDTVNQTTAEDVAEVVNFTIGDLETTLTCTATHLSAASSNVALVPVANVVFSGTAPNCVATITPALNQTGTSTITLTVSDGALTANDTFVQTVTAVNDAPTISDITNQVTLEDTARVVNFTINDVDSTVFCTSASLSASSTAPLVLTASTITFGGTAPNCTATLTPSPNASGSTVIGITVSDGTATANDTFQLDVTAVADDPVANNDSITILEDAAATPINVRANDGDPDPGSTLTVTAVTQGSFGTVVLNAGVVTYQPNANANGVDTFTYTLSDGTGRTDTATVTVTVTAVNDAPDISDIADQTTAEDTAEVVNFTITDVDSTVTCSATHLSVSSSNLGLVPPANVVISGTAPNCTATITPLANASGTVDLTFTVTDGTLTDSDVFTLEVTAASAPTITPIADLATAVGTPVQTSFVIADVDSALACSSANLSATSSNTTLLPVASITFSGTPGACTVTLTPAAGQAGFSDVTITVTADGQNSSSTFRLTVIDRIFGDGFEG